MKEQSDRQMQAQIGDRIRRNCYYEILDLPRTSSPDDIKKSYKKLALRFHPDKNKTQNATNVFNKISEAYTCLSNQTKKREYDQRQSYSAPKASCKKQDMRQEKYQPEQEIFNSAQFRYAEERLNGNKDERKKQRMREQRAMREQMRQKMEEAYQKYYQNASEVKRRVDEAEAKKKRFEEECRQRQKRRRTKLQELQQNKKRGIMVVTCIVFFYLIMGPILDSLKEQPMYSLMRNQVHRHQMTSSTFNQIYYVNDEFFTPEVTQSEKVRINQIINKKFILGLKKQCRESQRNKEIYQKRAKKQKTQIHRVKYIKMAQSVDMVACDELFKIIQEHPVYLSHLKV